MRENRVSNRRLSTALTGVIFLGGVGFFGQARGDNGSSSNGCSIKDAASICNAHKPPTDADQLCMKSILNECSGSSNDDNSCDSKINAMNKAERDFVASCVTSSSKPDRGGDVVTSLNSDNPPSPPPSSGKNDNRCIKAALTCKYRDEQTLDPQFYDVDVPKGASASTTETAQYYASCPSVASGKLDSLESQWKDRKSDYDNLKDKLDTLNQQVLDLKSKIQSAQNDYSNAMTKIDNETTQAKNQFDQDEQKLQMDAQQKFTEENNQITQLNENRQQAYDKARKALRDEQTTCYNHSMDALSAYLKDRNSKISASALTAGGQSQLFSGVGESRQQKNADVAYMYYQYCLTHPPYTDNVKTIQERLKSDLTALNDRIKITQTQQKTDMNNVFGQPGQQAQQRALNEITQTAQSKQKDAQTTYQNNLQSLYSQLNYLLGNGTGNSSACQSQNANARTMRFSDPGNALCASQILNTNNSRTNKASQGGDDGQIGYVQMELNKAKIEMDSAESLYRTANIASHGGEKSDKAGDITTNFDAYINMVDDAKSKCCPSDRRCSKITDILNAADPQDSSDDTGDSVSVTPPRSDKQRRGAVP